VYFDPWIDSIRKILTVMLFISFPAALAALFRRRPRFVGLGVLEITVEVTKADVLYVEGVEE
jgi:hypothetical protein